MPAGTTPPPPYQAANKQGEMSIQRWHDWFRQIDRLIEQAFLWTNINFTGSDIEDIVQKDHNQLDAMQGGNTPTDTEMFHLDASLSTKRPSNSSSTPPTHRVPPSTGSRVWHP